MIGKLLLYLITLLVLFLAIVFGLVQRTEPTFYNKPTLLQSNKESELNRKIDNTDSKKTLNILNKDGTLATIGWTNNDENLLFDSTLINPSSTILNNYIGKQLNKYRFKKWDAFAFSTKNWVGTFALIDLSYIGGMLFHVSRINRDPNEKFKAFSIQVLDPLFRPIIANQCNGKESCNNGITDKDIESYFSKTGVKSFKSNVTPYNNIFLNFKYENDEMSFNIDGKLNAKDKDSITMSIPISEDTTLFYYNVKKYCLNFLGNLTINGEVIPNEEIIFGFDAGRGAWPIKSGWVWVTGSGRTTEGKIFSLNTGNGFTHSSAGFGEDAFFIDGKLIKLYNLHYKIHNDDNLYGHKNWIFYNGGNVNKEKRVSDCELTFYVTNVKLNTIDVVIGKLQFDISYGFYTGICWDEEGKEHILDYATGQIENKMSLW